MNDSPLSYYTNPYSGDVTMPRAEFERLLSATHPPVEPEDSIAGVFDINKVESDLADRLLRMGYLPVQGDPRAIVVPLK